MPENNELPIDIDFLQSVVDGDKEFERELYEIFVENSAQYISKMEESAVSGDSNAWYMASHAFKGASASIGFFPLSRILEVAQTNSEASPEEKEKILDDVKREHGRADRYIKAELNKS